MTTEILWVEKYRPKTIKECILPEAIKRTFQEIVHQEELPNLLLSGSAGTGKTTVARALANELGIDCLLVNASENGNIDTLRTTIKNYASTVSLIANGKRKVLIMDEADYTNPNSTQPALRGFIEEFSKNCAFIFTANYRNRIIPAIHSRCSVIDFRIDSKEKPKLASQFMARVTQILATEKIKYSDAVIAQLITKYFPDFRRVLNEIQRYSIGGKIDEGILANIGDVQIKELVKSLKAKDFVKVRKWVVQTLDNDSTTLFRGIYDSLSDYLTEQSIPEAILHLSDGQYKAAFVADSEINTMATLINIMVSCEFK